MWKYESVEDCEFISLFLIFLILYNAFKNNSWCLALPDQLQKAKTYVMSNADCEDIWPEEEVTAGNVCLRNNETGACFVRI